MHYQKYQLARKLYLYSSYLRTENGSAQSVPVARVTTKNRDLGDYQSFPVQNRDYTGTIQRWRGLFAINSNAARGGGRASATTARDYYCATGVICIWKSTYICICMYVRASSSRGYLSLSLFLSLRSRILARPRYKLQNRIKDKKYESSKDTFSFVIT